MGKNNNNNSNNHKTKNKNKNNKNNDNNNRIKHVKDIGDLIKKTEDISLHSDSAEVTAIHSPIKLHYYDADISDSDTTNHHNFSPLHHPSIHFDSYSQKNIINNNPKHQILRTAKINQRSTSDINLNNTRSLFSSNLSPGFDRKHQFSPLLQHQFSPLSPLSPLPTLHRASSEPLTSSLKSIDENSSSLKSIDASSSDYHSVSFGDVEVHEFRLMAGAASDGVPEDGGYSLHLGPEEVNKEILNVDEYETKRYERWKDRAQNKLHWNKKKMSNLNKDPERYLFTNGRCDAFYSSLTPKEREKRLNIDKKWKKSHSQQVHAEKQELDQIRKSRKTNNIFCDCKPLSLMTTSQLKSVAKQHGIKIHENRKIKKGFLINQLKSKVLNYRDICCWDKLSCSCIEAGIDCHSGTEQKHFQCGCTLYRKKCGNPNGRYIYKPPYYAKSLITEWKEYYQNDNQNVIENENENDASRGVSFAL